jgi:hypothetical protein
LTKIKNQKISEIKANFNNECVTSMYHSSKVFNGKPVVNLSTATTAQDLSTISPMLRVEPEGEEKFVDVLKHFLATHDTTNMESLVIGSWSHDYDLSDLTDMNAMMDALYAKRDNMPALTAIFIGAIEEVDSAWIECVDLSKIINEQWFNLEYFRARGAGDFLDDDIDSTTLKKLALETSSMAISTIYHLLHSDLPNLEYLELWLGNGGNSAVRLNHITPLLTGQQFPKLRHLALRHCEFADELAVALATAPLVSQLGVLDVSGGNLSDVGLNALAQSANVQRLRKLVI